MTEPIINRNSGETTLHLISHTHWDREFYFSSQRFRYRLVHVVNELLDHLSKDASFLYYHLDGQTVVVEDYLEVENDQQEKLFQYIREGRLLVGPWYVLADEFLVSGESLIRNLLVGDLQSSRYGGKMNIGYLPDTFGHIGQMPQILRGFGMNEAVIWRGISDNLDEKLPTEWIWQGSDGSQVLAIHLPDAHGYTNGFYLPYEKQELKKELDRLYDELKPYSSTSHLLIMNGMDHQSAHLPIPGLLKELEGESTSYIAVHSTLPQYIESVRAEIKIEKLPILSGEFRSTNHGRAGIFNFVLPNVLSSRVHLIQWNQRVQTLLERWAEPFASLAMRYGMRYPAVLLHTAWKYLLLNHPHDSICGTSLDDAHRQMITRFEWARDIAEQAMFESLYLITKRINVGESEVGDKIIHVFNPLQFTATEAIEMDVPFPKDQEFKDVVLLDEQGNEIPVKLLHIDAKLYTPDYMEHWPPALTYPARMARISFLAEQVPGFGYRTYKVRSSSLPNRKWIQFSAFRAIPYMENEHLKIQFHSNGSFDMTDKASNTTYKQLHLFADGADIGDSYTYSESRTDQVFTTYGEKASFRHIEKTPIRNVYEVCIEWELPESIDAGQQIRSSKKVTCSLKSRITLASGAQRLDIETSFENKAKDHRLRVLFPTYLETDFADAQGSFEVVHRSLKVQQPLREVWIEDEPVSFPHQGFVDLSDGRKGLAVISPGIMEYEVMATEERALALTLMRAVGYLGASNRPLTIKNGAGPNVETPEAQCIGLQQFRYSLYPHSGNWQQGNVYEQAERFSIGLLGYIRPHKLSERTLDSVESLMHINNHNVIFSSFKKTEKRESNIIRLFNPTNEHQSTQISFPEIILSAFLTNLKEERIHSLDVNDIVNYNLRPGEIVTIEVQFLS